MNNHNLLEVVVSVRIFRRKIHRPARRDSNVASNVDAIGPRSEKSESVPLLKLRVVGQQTIHLLQSRQPERRWIESTTFRASPHRLRPMQRQRLQAWRSDCRGSSCSSTLALGRAKC